MKIRFGRPVRGEAEREDGLQLHHAAARRPGPPYWQRYLLLGAMLLPLLLVLIWGFRQLACA